MCESEERLEWLENESVDAGGDCGSGGRLAGKGLSGGSGGGAATGKGWWRGTGRVPCVLVPLESGYGVGAMTGDGGRDTDSAGPLTSDAGGLRTRVRTGRVVA
jgi:hypothetical protein